MASTTSVAGLPFKMNPPLHPSLWHVVPDLSVTTSQMQKISFEGTYAEKAQAYEANAVESLFNSLRLGRIVMGTEAMSFALQNQGTRYGFRFLYNPTTVKGSSNVGTDFIPDPSNTITAILQEGLEQISFELLLSRMPELQGGATKADYNPSISDEDWKDIQQRGTHADVEYLYRVCNGMHNTRQRQGTGDIGILLPNPVELFLGPYRTTGTIQSISTSDQLYSPNMVPMLTFVQVTFQRIFMTLESEYETLRAAGISNTVINSTAAGPSTYDNTPQPTTAQGKENGGKSEVLDPKVVQQLAQGAGFGAHDAKTMTQIAWGESGWNRWSHNPNASTGDNSYGLWQINMLGDMGPARRKAFGITENRELFDPHVNAKAARLIHKSQGFSAWSVYTNGKYRKAPSW